jgi:hypothetical protein
MTQMTQMSADGIREYAVFLHLRTSVTSADSCFWLDLARVHGKKVANWLSKHSDFESLSTWGEWRYESGDT